MIRRVAFHAPLKPPDHPVPSGDRRMARSLIAALEHAGLSVALPSRLRSYDRGGDPAHQHRIATLGAYVADRLLRRWRHDPTARPDAWLTYHVYHKSPDWLGPVIAPALGIPYLIVEASHAAKRASGPYAFNYRAAERAIRLADVVLAITAVDAAGLEPLIKAPAELRGLPPFLDPAPYLEAAAARNAHRAALAARFKLDHETPWLLAVGMMRQDAKLESYRLLAEALRHCGHLDWQLLIAGDGPARREVEAAFAPCHQKVAIAGALDEAELAKVYASADLLVWPAVREAYGLAMLEAQACGLPVIAGNEGGVADVVQDGRTGLLVPPRNPVAFAKAVTDLLDDPARRKEMAVAASAFVQQERSLATASATLHQALEAAAAIRVRRCGC